MAHYKGCDKSTYTFLFEILKSAYRNGENQELITSLKKWLILVTKTGLILKQIAKKIANALHH